MNFEKNGSEVKDAFWTSARLTLEQLQGIADGFNSKVRESEKLELVDLFMLNGYADFDNLAEYWAPKSERKRRAHTRDRTHCTGTIYYNEDDIYFSQITWTTFETGFIRIAKTYMFNYSLSTTLQQNVTFSSYPGLLFSIDDFYIVHSFAVKENKTKQFGVLETTISLFNESFEQFVDKTGNISQMTWIRVVAANFLATAPDNWLPYFDVNSSFTYNNNYLVVDYSAFFEFQQEMGEGKNVAQVLQQMVDNKTVFIQTIEYVPRGDLESYEICLDETNCTNLTWDATEEFLDEHFYLSINVPVNPIIFEYVNTTTEDPYFSYEASARLNITRELLGDGKANWDDYIKYLSYNDFENNPAQRYDPAEGISSRYDLRIINEEEKRTASCFGATDHKVADLEMVKEFYFEFLVGPTLGTNEQFKPFSFDYWNNNNIDNETVIVTGVRRVFDNLKPSNFTGRAVYNFIDRCIEDQSFCLCEENDDIDDYGICGKKHLTVQLSLSIPYVVFILGAAVYIFFYFRVEKRSVEEIEEI